MRPPYKNIGGIRSRPTLFPPAAPLRNRWVETHPTRVLAGYDPALRFFRRLRPYAIYRISLRPAAGPTPRGGRMRPPYKSIGGIRSRPTLFPPAAPVRNRWVETHPTRVLAGYDPALRFFRRLCPYASGGLNRPYKSVGGIRSRPTLFPPAAPLRNRWVESPLQERWRDTIPPYVVESPVPRGVQGAWRLWWRLTLSDVGLIFPW